MEGLFFTLKAGKPMIMKRNIVLSHTKKVVVVVVVVVVVELFCSEACEQNYNLYLRYGIHHTNHAVE
jgi:hypothetical protein